ncbi:MAG TPA: Rieske 2Fe-2S domain-containing protein [Vicinamibacteria bacterium]|nr:Rieske 2Fe-2S domain-containing protein [Vicinamibacteria bacterium]
MAAPVTLDAAPAEATAGEAQWLYGFWYPALRSHRVRGARMAPARLLGLPLLVGRTSGGGPFAMRDSCPHRGIPLSYGRFDGREVECSYHGWRFEPRSGQCRSVPSLAADSRLRADRIFAAAFPCREADGFFWVFLPQGAARAAGEVAPPGELPGVPRVPVLSDRHVLTHLAADLPCSVDHGIIGLMDPAHGPFVHQSWWWRKRDSIHEKQKRFEPIPNGFRMSAHAPSSNSAPYRLMRFAGMTPGDRIETTIDFVLPNLRFEVVRCGAAWFSTLTTVTPLAPRLCRIDVRAAWNLFLWATPLVLPIGRFFGRKFVRQDQRTMERQAEGLAHDPRLMLVDDADRPAKWYFALKQACLESQRTGQAMKHPLAGPVTLRWRS